MKSRHDRKRATSTSSARKRAKFREEHTSHNFSNMKLDNLLVKNLLQDIEKSGKTRKDFSLPALVNTNPNLYGGPGSELRRAVQKKFDQVQRKKPKNYRKLLDQVRIILSFVVFGSYPLVNCVINISLPQVWSQSR